MIRAEKKPESAEAVSGFFAFKGLGFPLENEFQTKLNVSRPTRADHRIRSSHVRRGVRSAKSTRLGGVFVKQRGSFRIRERRMIQYVEKFRAELQSHPLGQPRVFHQRKIPVVEARASKQVAPHRTEGAEGGRDHHGVALCVAAE